MPTEVTVVAVIQVGFLQEAVVGSELAPKVRPGERCCQPAPPHQGAAWLRGCQCVKGAPPLGLVPRGRAGSFLSAPATPSPQTLS